MLREDPDHLDPFGSDEIVAFAVPLCCAVVSMSGAVDFHAQEEGGAEEVEDERRYRFLPAELESEASPGPQQFPRSPLRSRRFPPELGGECLRTRMSIAWHWDNIASTLSNPVTNKMRAPGVTPSPVFGEGEGG